MNLMTPKKFTTAIKLTTAIEQEMLKMVVEEGYGLRGKSRWLTEAIEGFLRLPNYPELVDMADVEAEQDKVVSLRLDETLMQRVENAIITIRREYPAIEGVKSKIFRASIVQRLLNRAAYKNFQ